ncbi:hypothetical protein B0A49_10486 [Cryomyces minteri]|uniref:Transketolase-like pyrimidine-binding domain-containing protein n=1 Tax=Cryomyces minteri TaxID=331657 RepID=A0A4U0X8B7_9PEZI|nr:hypothetical protein B0A49_10486 [Cryomyces minteri]
MVLNPIAKEMNILMVGTADLTPSVNMSWEGKLDFQSPDIKTTCGINGDYTGRYIHYGIREHAMAAISNGLAAYNPGTIVPVTSSFFMFYLYAASAVRMGALQKLQTIHIATHDSIGTGEDGPTHQPIELAALFRAMPNMYYLRPCDSEETAGSMIVALESKTTPCIISLSRQALPQLAGSTRDKVALGAYVLQEVNDADVTLLGTGSELNFAVDTAALLLELGIKARVVSFPCQRLFEAQSQEYKRSVLRRLEGDNGRPSIVVEAYSSNGWERYADAGFCMHSFGHSLPGKEAYRHFGFVPKVMASKLKKYLERNKGVRFPSGEFKEL